MENDLLGVGAWTFAHGSDHKSKKKDRNWAKADAQVAPTEMYMNLEIRNCKPKGGPYQDLSHRAETHNLQYSIPSDVWRVGNP